TRCAWRFRCGPKFRTLHRNGGSDRSTSTPPRPSDRSRSTTCDRLASRIRRGQSPKTCAPSCSSWIRPTTSRAHPAESGSKMSCVNDNDQNQDRVLHSGFLVLRSGSGFWPSNDLSDGRRTTERRNKNEEPGTELLSGSDRQDHVHGRRAEENIRRPCGE